MKNERRNYLPDAGVVLARRHTVVDQVHELMLEAIRIGELGAGDELRDQTWATRLGISRTPIREAIKRLEGHGLVSIAAARFTRIISFTPEEARHEARDWAVTHLALLEEVELRVDRALFAELEALRERVHNATEAERGRRVFAFFERIRAQTTSFSLQLGATAAAYRLELARSSLVGHSGADAALCADIIAALQGAKNETGALAGAFARWTRAVSRA